MMCLVVGHVQFGSSLLRRLLSQASGSRELEARVVQSKNGRLVGHPYWFGGEGATLACGRVPHEYVRCRLKKATYIHFGRVWRRLWARKPRPRTLHVHLYT